MRKIKILKASYLYSEYITKFYVNNIGIKNESYSQQYSLIVEDMFGWCDVWKRTLESSDSFEVIEIMLTNEIIQKKWAEENNINYSERNWLMDIFQAQLVFFEPDVLFAHDNIHLTTEVIKKIKSSNTFVKLVIGYDGIALNNLNRFEEFDIVLSCLESTSNYYTNGSKGKIKGYFLPLGFDTMVLEKLTISDTRIPFSFVGSLVRGQGYHMKRIKDLTKLANNSPVKIYSNGMGEPYEPYRYLQRNRLKKLEFKEFWQVYSIGRKTKTPVFGMDMYNLLASSDITFNCHLDNANGKAANMRLFEATGVGSCLITDYMDNLKDFFDIDNEVVTYKSIPECIDKVKNLLRDDKLRKKISIAGQNKTLSQHTFQSRIIDFSNFLNLTIAQL